MSMNDYITNFLFTLTFYVYKFNKHFLRNTFFVIINYYWYLYSKMLFFIDNENSFGITRRKRWILHRDRGSVGKSDSLSAARHWVDLLPVSDPLHHDEVPPSPHLSPVSHQLEDVHRQWLRGHQVQYCVCALVVRKREIFYYTTSLRVLCLCVYSSEWRM